MAAVNQFFMAQCGAATSAAKAIGSAWTSRMVSGCSETTEASRACRLSLRLLSPTKQAYEADNRLKAVIDLLVAHQTIQADDWRTVRKITVEVSDTGEPGARIEVTPMLEAARSCRAR
jgi:hypothetical protein